MNLQSEKGSFYIDVDVQSSDIDSYQHVNNTVYHKWIDECARLHSTELGVDPELASEFGSGMAVLESSVVFVSPALKGDPVRIITRIIENDGRLKIKRKFEIRNPVSQKLLVRAELIYVCINIRTGKACRMPDDFVRAYQVHDQ